MGIRGIDNLKGYTMDNEQAPGQETPQSADPTLSTPNQTPQESTPSEPASEPAPTQADDDVAPDADEPGDTELPEELQEHVHEGDVPQDDVDHPAGDEV